MRRAGAHVHSTTGMQAPPLDMLAAGIDIIPDKKNNVGAKREKRGECPTCGVQTHKTALFGKKTPLTVEGVVYKGQCLVCHPLEGYIRRDANNVYNQSNQYSHAGAPQHQMQQAAPQQIPQETDMIMPDVPQLPLQRGQTEIVQPTHRLHLPRHSMPQNMMIQHQRQMMLQQPQYFPEAKSGINVPHSFEVRRMDDDVSVITMDYPLTQGARKWTPGTISGVSYNSDEDTDVQPPAPSRRPGPDSGDTISNQEPRPARVPAPHCGPSFRGNHRELESSHRRNPENFLPTTQENSPDLAMNYYNGDNTPLYKSGYPTQEQKHDHSIGSRSQRQGFDADGYPSASTGYGWDKQADLLPPGGTDMLFHNRSGEMDLPLPAHRLQTSTPSEEIKFQPPGRSAHERLPVMTTERNFLGKRRQNSIESGPMFLSDDVPNSSGDRDSPMPPQQTRLHMQVSEPIFNTGIGHDFVKYNGSRDAILARPPGIRATKTLGAAKAHPSYLTAEPYNQSLHGRSAASIAVGNRDEDEEYMSGTMFDPRRSADESASHSSCSTGRPLVSRDLRGRPDDDSIHEPSTTMQSTYFDNPLMGTLLGEGHEDDPPPNWPTSISTHSRGVGTKGTKKAPPEQYAPELSPVGAARRGGGQYRMVESNTGEERKLSFEPMYMHDSDDVQVAHTTMPPAPALHKHVSSDIRATVKAPHSSDHEFYAASTAKSNVTPARVTDMIRKLSITPKEEKSEESLTNRPGVHLLGGQEQTVDDIPVIMHCLGLKQADSNLKANALRSLATILWKSGRRGRNSVIESKGVEILVTTMWDDMGNDEIQDAAAEFLLAFAASSDANPSNDTLANEDACCDSLLFAMQTHSNMPGIQLKGCAIFSCLAAASSNNSSVSDGSLSGALTMVLAAMSNHGLSVEIQKAGLQALYHQCTLSKDAESNKRNLVESQLENGSSGLGVILDAMKSPLRKDQVAMEWACRLCWSLTSSEDLVKKISGIAVMIGEVTEICHQNIANENSSSLLEACFGVMGNMAHVETNRIELVRFGGVAALMEGMRYYSADYPVSLEACSALANLALSQPIRDAILQGGGLETILRALHTYIDYHEFVAEALRALVCLAVQSQEGKEAMSTPDVIELVIVASMKHQDSVLVHEMCCKLLASLAIHNGTSEIIIEDGGLDLIQNALQSQSDEKVRDAACFVYRNLACQLQKSDPLLQNGALKSVIITMSSHENSLSIQTNGCCAIWNIAFKAKEVVGSQGVQVIVKAMQTHMESSELLEVACGALWSIVDESIDRKKDVVGSGAIDAVICALVMHPNTESMLIKASGVFSNLSAEGSLAEAIANAQGVNVVCDAICNNGSAVAFLETCCLTLRNLVFHYPECAGEVTVTISTILDAMREQINDSSFQIEACNFLWVLAAEAGSCLEKISELDGMSVLMQSLDQNGDDPEVHAAATGAIEQLAGSGN